MPENLIIKMKVPIPSSETDETGGLGFNQWLPLRTDERITIPYDNGWTVALFFDLDSARTLSVQSEEELRRHVNVYARYIFVEVEVPDLNVSLANHIRSGSPHQNVPSETLESNFSLGQSVYTVTVESVNRLLHFARSEKGQYWLRPLRIELGCMASAFVHYQARAWVGAEGPFYWEPTHVVRLAGRMPDESRYIRKDEWDYIKRFVVSNSRTSLVNELLSNADDLLARGFRRSALLEAVAALEVAISRVKDVEIANSRWFTRIGARVTAESLGNHINRLGLSATVRYLIPLLIEEIDSETIASCAAAIEQRQTVAHQGQRDVAEGKARTYLRSVRVLCEGLAEYRRA